MQVDFISKWFNDAPWMVYTPTPVRFLGVYNGCLFIIFHKWSTIENPCLIVSWTHTNWVNQGTLSHGYTNIPQSPYMSWLASNNIYIYNWLPSVLMHYHNDNDSIQIQWWTMVNVTCKPNIYPKKTIIPDLYPSPRSVWHKLGEVERLRKSEAWKVNTKHVKKLNWCTVWGWLDYVSIYLYHSISDAHLDWGILSCLAETWGNEK